MHVLFLYLISNVRLRDLCFLDAFFQLSRDRSPSNPETITSLPISIPLSTVQPNKLPVSIPLASVVLPSRVEKVCWGSCNDLAALFYRLNTFSTLIRRYAGVFIDKVDYCLMAESCSYKDLSDIPTD